MSTLTEPQASRGRLSDMDARRALVLAAVCLLVVTGCGQPPAAHGRLPVGQLTAPAGAAAAAHRLLDIVQLGKGQRAVSAAPSPRLPGAQQPDSGDPVVVQSRWWTVPGTVAAFDDFSLAHPPNGWRSSHDAAGEGPSYAAHWTPTRDDSDPAQPRVVLYAVQDGDHVDVQADAFLTWQVARAATAILAGSIRSLQIDYQSPARPNGSYGPLVQRVVTGEAARRIVALVNISTDVDPDTVRTCPRDSGEQAWITAGYGSHVAFVTASMSGCRDLQVDVDHVSGSGRQAPDALDAAIRAGLGLPSPPASAVVGTLAP